MKKITITSPFIENILPFQRPIYEVAKAMNFCCKEHVFIPRWSHYFIFNYPVNFAVPFLQKKNFVRLQFVSGTHPEPMIFPYAYGNEIIPIVWDCWPDFVQHMVKVFKRCNIKVAFFSSKQTADFFSNFFPQKKIFFLPEAINTDLYYQGSCLETRTTDVLEYGRLYKDVHEQLLQIPGIQHMYARDGEFLFNSFDDLAKHIAMAKIVICYPRSVTHPNIAQGIETLTQRYWECMISKTIIVGKAPKELVDLLGYNPVVETPVERIQDTVTEILNDVSRYQSLVDKNYFYAKKNGDWKVRFRYVEETLGKLGYSMRS